MKTSVTKFPLILLMLGCIALSPVSRRTTMQGIKRHRLATPVGVPTLIVRLRSLLDQKRKTQ